MQRAFGVVMKRRQEYRWLENLGFAFLICLSGVGTSLAQGQTEKSGPPIEILKLHWEKQIRLPSNFDPSILPTNGAFSDPSTSASAGVGVSGANPNLRPSAASVFPPTPARLPVTYVYTMKIRNLGSKIIEGVAWDYAFLDASGVEIARRQFLTYVKIPPNKAMSVEGRMRTSHIRLVRASNSASSSLTKDRHPKFTERGIIQCLLYDDDTFWRSPAAKAAVCDFLKSERALMKDKSRSAQH
jgi:hypothetical protein